MGHGVAKLDDASSQARQLDVEVGDSCLQRLLAGAQHHHLSVCVRVLWAGCGGAWAGWRGTAAGAEASARRQQNACPPPLHMRARPAARAPALARPWAASSEPPAGCPRPSAPQGGWVGGWGGVGGRSEERVAVGARTGAGAPLPPTRPLTHNRPPTHPPNRPPTHPMKPKTGREASWGRPASRCSWALACALPASTVEASYLNLRNLS